MADPTSSPLAHEAIKAAASTAPPVVVTLAMKLGALSPADWAAIATIVYVVVQTAYLLWKWRREWAAIRPRASAATE